MSARDDLLHQVQNELNECEIYAAYAKQVGDFYSKRDSAAKWIVAVASCGPFIDKLNIEFADFSSWLLALIPLIAIALPILSYTQKIERARSLHADFVTIIPSFKKLWRDICGNEEPSDNQLSSWRSRYSQLDVALAKIRTGKSAVASIPKIKKSAESAAKRHEYKKKYSSGSGGAEMVDYQTR